MQEPERPLKRKDQVTLDEQMAKDVQAQLDAEIIEEERLERQKQEEANIAMIESWENTQAMMEADRLLAERLQTREREELTGEEKGKLFMELMEKRRKHFAALRAQEKRNKPPSKAQKRTQMSTYLKHMEAQESNKKKVEGSKEKAKGSRKKMLGRKRVEKEQQQESLKKQRMEDDKETDEHEEVEADDTTELKSIWMLQGIDREDLEALCRIVKAKYGDTRPEDEFERVLYGDLRVILLKKKLEGFSGDITFWENDCWSDLKKKLMDSLEVMPAQGYIMEIMLSGSVFCAAGEDLRTVEDLLLSRG
ncbi:hypothetical protein Tco_1294747 [Tanacetum coccineum]